MQWWFTMWERHWHTRIIFPGMLGTGGIKQTQFGRDTAFIKRLCSIGTLTAGTVSSNVTLTYGLRHELLAFVSCCMVGIALASYVVAPVVGNCCLLVDAVGRLETIQILI